MENPLISVIVPVYNGEKFIDRVMSSLVDQCPNQIEIILVNDGSTDNSSQLCHKYESKYFNVKVVDKKNGGLSTARNAGMKVAKGEYISFIDVDDFIDINAYEKIIDVVIKYKPDIIDFGFKYISRFGEISTNINALEKNVVLSREYIINQVIPPLINLKKDKRNFIFDFAWNKIFKNKILLNNDIVFNERRRTWEDRIFVVEFLKYANTYFSMNDYFYNYMDIIDSLSRRYDLQFFDIILENYQFYYDNFSEYYNFDIEYVYDYWSKSIENMIYRSLAETDNKDIIDKNIKNVLANKLVVEWYSKRICHDSFDEQISRLIVDGNINKVLNLYKKRHYKNQVEKKNKEKIFKIKRLIKKFLFIK